MRRVAVLYFSATGATAALAEALGAGAGEAGAEVSLCRIAPERIVEGRFRDEAALAAADAADGVAFGSPTYMGGPAAGFKALADATGERWAERRWAGKVAAGFTTGSAPDGDQGHTLAYFALLAAQHGMLWCGLDLPGGGADPEGRNRPGASLGATAHAPPPGGGPLDPSDLATARHLGRRLATLAARPRRA